MVTAIAFPTGRIVVPATREPASCDCTALPDDLKGRQGLAVVVLTIVAAAKPVRLVLYRTAALGSILSRAFTRAIRSVDSPDRFQNTRVFLVLPVMRGAEQSVPGIGQAIAA